MRSQVSFLSETPRADLEDLAAWARDHDMEAVVGAYSDKEFYLDAPAAFVDFVIEAMTPDLADYGVDVSPRLKILKTVEPSGRKSGVMVKSVAELVAKLHDEAHHRCFIANSVRSAIRIEPRA